MLSDAQIKRLCEEQQMIVPYVPTKRRVLENGRNVPSYGQTSFGYDVRLANEILLPNPGTVIDPMGTSEWSRVVCTSPVFTMNPYSFILAHTIEKFHIPDDVIGIAVGKSTYARCGIITPLTPLEPGWKGTLTLEISNTTNNYVKLYIGAGIIQILFDKGEKPESTYTADEAIYQGTTGTVPAGYPKISKDVARRWENTFMSSRSGSRLNTFRPLTGE